MNDTEQPRSLLSWFYMALGPFYLGLLLLAGLLCFVLTLVIVTRGRGGMSSTALLFIVPIPLLIGIFGAIQGAINSFTVIAMGGATPKASEIAQGVSLSLVAPLFGMLLMLPSYGVAVLGSLFRSFPAPTDDRPNEK